MRRIENEEMRLARQKKNQRILSLILLAILVLSSVGYAFTAKDSQTTSQNSDIFQLSDGRWQVQINDQPFIFAYSPKQVESIPVSGAMPVQYYASSPLYIASNASSINYELSSTLGRYIPLTPACLGECMANLPEKNCSSVIIVWNQSIENKVYTQDNCVFIEGDLKAVDAFLYKVFGLN